MTSRKRIFGILFLLLILCTCLWVYVQYQDVRGPGVPVLLYHGVMNGGSSSKYVLDAGNFERQLRWLKDHGYTTLLPRDIRKMDTVISSQKKVILTFDDGRKDNFEIVYPLLKKYGFSAVFFIVTGAVDTQGIVSSDDLREMSNGGMEIGSHTISHPFLDTLDQDDIVSQLQKSKKKLEMITGKTVTSLAPPGGWFDDKVVQIAQQQGYDHLFGCEIGLNDLSRDPYVYKRIEVLRGISMAQFSTLLVPVRAFTYKLKQSLKFTLHSIIGTSNYVKLSHAI